MLIVLKEGDVPYDWREDAYKAGVFMNASPDSIALVPYYALRLDDRFVLSDTSESNDNDKTNTSISTFVSSFVIVL